MGNDHYQLVTINDGKSDADAIIKVFSAMQDGRLKCDLSLLNYCNEVPVCYSATIATVEDDSVELSVHEHQALIMKQNNSTLIKSQHFGKGLGVHCYAAYVNVPKKAAILHNFAYAQIRADRREAVRVKVTGALPVTFICGQVVITGTMIDISATGISLLSNGIVPATVEGAGVISFPLEGTPLTMPALFVRAKPSNNDNQQVCIFTIAPDRITDSAIGRFIYQRQVEIILALKEGMVIE
ncbi:MAG: PilZ domain-containing protein [Trichlorobacter sp.]|jgi:hypothetical protein